MKDVKQWYVLSTRPHHERAVYERLVRNAFEVYLPMARVSRTSNGVRREASVPLLARQLFARCYLEMYTHLELITTPGVMRLREDPRGGFLAVPDEEIRTLQQLSNAGIPLEEGPYQIQGERVQVVQGPLRGIVGVIREGSRTILLVPIHALKQSVAVRISRTQVVQCANVRRRPRATDSSDTLTAEM